MQTIKYLDQTFLVKHHFSFICGSRGHVFTTWWRLAGQRKILSLVNILTGGEMTGLEVEDSRSVLSVASLAVLVFNDVKFSLYFMFPIYRVTLWLSDCVTLLLALKTCWPLIRCSERGGEGTNIARKMRDILWTLC